MNRLAAVFLTLLLISPGNSSAQTSQKAANRTSTVVSAAEKAEWETLKKRFTEYGREYVLSAMWTLIHNYRSKSRLEEAMHLIEALLDSLAKNDSAKLHPIGGPEGFNNRFLKLMQSQDDDTVAGFAARVLAVCGGMRYAPQIAALMNKRDKSWTDDDVYPTPTSRGQAAIALSILTPTQYTEDIAALLQSQNVYDRSGANLALGHLRATKYAREIANLLLKKEFTFRIDGSPIYSLIEMGVASEYKKEIARALTDDFASETVKTAAYALAHLRATEYSPEIAKLLGEEYRRGDAAKALAIMGAREYAPNIALLLDNESSLDRSDALLALGILKAREYAPSAARLMRRERESFVGHNAARSLILMGATEYAREAVVIVEKNHKSGPYVGAGDFHPLVAEEAREINKQFLTAIEQLKSRK